MNEQPLDLPQTRAPGRSDARIIGFPLRSIGRNCPKYQQYFLGQWAA